MNFIKLALKNSRNPSRKNITNLENRSRKKPNEFQKVILGKNRKISEMAHVKIVKELGGKRETL